MFELLDRSDCQHDEYQNGYSDEYGWWIPVNGELVNGTLLRKSLQDAQQVYGMSPRDKIRSDWTNDPVFAENLIDAMEQDEELRLLLHEEYMHTVHQYWFTQDGPTDNWKTKYFTEWERKPLLDDAPYDDRESDFVRNNRGTQIQFLKKEQRRGKHVYEKITGLWQYMSDKEREFLWETIDKRLKDESFIVDREVKTTIKPFTVKSFKGREVVVINGNVSNQKKTFEIVTVDLSGEHEVEMWDWREERILERGDEIRSHWKETYDIDAVSVILW